MAFSERYVDTGGSNLNGGFPIGGIYPVTETGGTFTQGGGAGGNDRFAAAAGTPFSGCAIDDCVSVYADGGSAPTGYVGVITAINGGGASIDLHLTRFSGTRPSGAGKTAKVGGAWAGPSGASGFPFGFATVVLTNAALDPVRVNFAAGTYAVTAAMTAGNNGPIHWAGTLDGSNQPTSIIDGGATGTSFIPLTVSGTNNFLSNFHFTQNGDSGTAAALLSITGTNCMVTRSRFTDAWRDGMQISGGGARITECEFHSCNIDDASDFGGASALEESTWVRCWFHSNDPAPTNSGSGFLIKTGSGEPLTMISCVFEGNGKHGAHAPAGSVAVHFIGCDFVGNGESGASSIPNAASLYTFENCNFVGNGDYGIEYFSANGTVRAVNCGFQGNGIAPTLNVNASFLTGTVSYGSTPFTDAPNGNVELNTTAGAGADARNAGIGTFLQDSAIYSDTTTSYPDIGAAQHDETAPAGGQTSYTFG